MIAEAIPAAYDESGKKVFRPFDRRKGPRPTFPLGRYVSRPLAVRCRSIEEVRQFLRECKYVSDKELFDKEEYWQPPEDFEKLKKGDCEDFAFWTWRQLMDLGQDCRVVFGPHGRYGVGHAWVQVIRDGKCFIVEPQRSRFGKVFPRLSTLEYHPKFPVAWDGEKLTYYQHRELQSRPSFVELSLLLPEYFAFWGRFWIGSPLLLLRLPWFLIKRFLRGFRWNRKADRA
jgi:hypothetical protein